MELLMGFALAPASERIVALNVRKSSATSSACVYRLSVSCLAYVEPDGQLREDDHVVAMK